MLEIPLGLRQAITSKKCVLFVGAGIGNHMTKRDGSKAPDAAALVKDIAQHFSVDDTGDHNLATVAQYIQTVKSRESLESYLKEHLSDLEPDQTLLKLFSLKWKAIYTTNFDNGIERAYELLEKPKQKPVPITLNSDMSRCDSRFDVPVVYLHGTLFGSVKPQIIITEDDYARFRNGRRMLFEILKQDMASQTILYVGYSHKDHNWNIILQELKEDFFPTQIPISYRVDPYTDEIQKTNLKARRVDSIVCTLSEFVESISLLIPGTDIDDERVKGMYVPSDLAKSFEESPAAVARLLSSWTYVNQAPFNEKPNTADFLRGDRPNWALIGDCCHFERDVEEQVYDGLLDFATTSSKKATTSIVLGPAGYGITTLLMSLAAKLVKDQAGSVFMLKHGATIKEGDIDFALTSTDKRTFFFVDNAADHSSTLNTIMHNLKETSRAAMFVMGERLNEWHIGRGKLRAKEYLIEPLSDPEIYRLLSCLAKNNELNKLEHLSEEMQFQAIKVKHNKELLVAMREATEGKGFDAIIEDEFRGIKDIDSRKTYLNVCAIYQHGAYVRDQLLAVLMDMSVTDLYQKTSSATEGIIIYDNIDEGNGIYGARARHRTIAMIIWERCGLSEEKEKALLRMLNSVNLTYSVDRKAFESIYSDDRMVNSIRGIEGKIKFFEAACKKAPMSPYVRQHYARMLSKEGKHELALSQIKEALDLDSTLKILYHTKGMILMEMALSIESHDVALKRLMQSEESFRHALRIHKRDEYCYQGLAQLYIGWARGAQSAEEAAEYIAKAEEVINEGLKTVRIRESLWIESSKIQEFLGDKPSYIVELKKAVQDNKSGIIARYLLGREYRKTHEYQKALDVLDQIVKKHHDEFRSFVEYALCLIYMGRPYSEAIAVLNLSTLFGLSDPRFIATLGGMYFMNKEFGKAKEIFSETFKHDFTAYEQNAVQFRPCKPQCPEEVIRLEGKVIAVKAGYCYVETLSYDPLICPASKYEGTIMKKGLRVSFGLGFAAKGPVAEKPQPI